MSDRPCDRARVNLFASSGVSPTRSHCPGVSGGRTWWAHFEFTRINITPTILRKKIEDQIVLGAICFRTCVFSLWKSHAGQRVLDE